MRTGQAETRMVRKGKEKKERAAEIVARNTPGYAGTAKNGKTIFQIDGERAFYGQLQASRPQSRRKGRWGKTRIGKNQKNRKNRKNGRYVKVEGGKGRRMDNYRDSERKK